MNTLVEFVELLYAYTATAFLLAFIFSALWWIACATRIKYYAHRSVGLKDYRLDEGESYPTVKALWLIHGTFARNARWAAPDGPLALELQQRYPNAQIRSFRWTGINSFQARAKASRVLLSELNEYTKRESGARIVLVGHSHGGSIALRVADRIYQCDPNARVDVVCLGAPILTSTKSTSFLDRTVDLSISAILLSLALDEILSSFCNALSEEVWTCTWHGMEIWWSILFLCALTAVLLLRLTASRSLPPARTTSLHIPEERLHMIRIAGDEASALLNGFYSVNFAVQAMNWSPNIIRRFILKFGGSLAGGERLSVAATTLLLHVALGLFITSLGAILIVSKFYEPIVDLAAFSLVAALFIILLAISFSMLRHAIKALPDATFMALRLMLSVILTPIVVVIHTLCGMLCGPEAALVGSWRQFAAESVPAGRWRLHVYEPRADSLKHSEIYERQDVLEAIANEIP